MGAVVYEAIRDAIVEGRIAADEQLVQEQLAAELGVSRTPVRDALNRLSHEGLVRAVLGRGYQVIDLTDPHIDYRIQAVEEILKGLGLQDKPRLRVFNKADRVGDGTAQAWAGRYNGVVVSALDRSTLRTLIERMQEYFLAR